MNSSVEYCAGLSGFHHCFLQCSEKIVLFVDSKKMWFKQQKKNNGILKNKKKQKTCFCFCLSLFELKDEKHEVVHHTD